MSDSSFAKFNPRRYRFRRQKMSLEVSAYSQCPLRDELMYVQLVDVAVENVIIIRSIRPPSPRYIRCKYVCKNFNGNFGVACSEDPKWIVETFSQKKKPSAALQVRKGHGYTNSRFAVLRACSRELLERMRGCVLDCSHTRAFTTGSLSTTMGAAGRSELPSSSPESETIIV